MKNKDKHKKFSVAAIESRFYSLQNSCVQLYLLLRPLNNLTRQEKEPQSSQNVQN